MTPEEQLALARQMRADIERGLSPALVAARAADRLKHHSSETKPVEALRTALASVSRLANSTEVVISEVRLQGLELRQVHGSVGRPSLYAQELAEYDALVESGSTPKAARDRVILDERDLRQRHCLRAALHRHQKKARNS